MESIINTFHIDWKIIVAQVFNFAVVFYILYYFAIKPINKLMAERTKKISQGIDDAKSNSELLAATKVEYEDALAKARAEAQSIFNIGKKEADKKKRKVLLFPFLVGAHGSGGGSGCEGSSVNCPQVQSIGEDCGKLTARASPMNPSTE